MPLFVGRKLLCSPAYHQLALIYFLQHHNPGSQAIQLSLFPSSFPLPFPSSRPTLPSFPLSAATRPRVPRRTTSPSTARRSAAPGALPTGRMSRRQSSCSWCSGNSPLKTRPRKRDPPRGGRQWKGGWSRCSRGRVTRSRSSPGGRRSGRMGMGRTA